MNNPTYRTLVCIPTFNERENINLIVPAVLEALPDGHVLVIDDNSPDGTGQLADVLAAKWEQVHVLHRTQKEGLGKAYLAGFAWGIEHGFDHLIEFDADFSHNPCYLPQMEQALATHDVVIGSRRVAGGGVENWGLIRQLISSGGSCYAHIILGGPVKDFTGGLNGMRRSALEAINYQSIEASGFLFQIELKYRCVLRKLRIKEIPIIFVDRVRGQSKMSGSIFKEALIAVWKLRIKNTIGRGF